MKRKPRVLIDSFHLIQALTGIRTYTTQLCEGIEKSNFEEVEYLIYPSWRWLNKTSFLRGKVNPVKKIINHLLYFAWKQCCLPLIILVKRIDMVVAPDYLLPYCKFGALSLAVFHDTFYWELKGKYNPIWRWYFLRSVAIGLNKRSKIIVTSNYIAEKVSVNVSDQLELFVVYQAPKGLNYSNFNAVDFHKLGLPLGAKYLLHVGIFENRKNLSVLIKAFSALLRDKQYADFYLILVGSRAAGWFHDDFHNLNQLIKDLKLEDKVIMPGFIPNEVLGTIYKNAFAYVFPSKEEGFGIPVIEAMTANIPVIISNQPALMEVADDAALVFEMDSEESLYNELLKLMNEEVRQNLLKKGSERVLSFTQQAFVNRFHEVVINNLTK